jgi:pilus assembly protein CpaF
MFGRRKAVSGKLEQEEVTDTYSIEEIEYSEKKNGHQNTSYSTIFEKVRQRFFDLLDPAVAVSLEHDQLSLRIDEAVSRIVDDESLPLNGVEQRLLAWQLFDDIAGIGPIESLLSDLSISDILVNGSETIYVERHGKLELTELKFRDEAHVLETARRIAASVGRRLDEANPMVDARLKDGSRVNVIAPPLSVYGTIISIRKFSKNLRELKEMQDGGSLSCQIHSFLKIAVKCRLNILIAGGTGSGKTTLLNALCGLIGEHERIVTIEDAAEIFLPRPNVVSLETRQKNSEGRGEVSQRDLLKNSLRMRPDRIIVGEVRGSEVHDMLQAMNTGHDGSMSTIHANSARDSLLRLENLILSSQSNCQSKGARHQISSAIDMVIFLERRQDGRRCIQSIFEIVGIEGEVITSQEIFRCSSTDSFDTDHTKALTFSFSGIRPGFQGKIQKYKMQESMIEVLAK